MNIRGRTTAAVAAVVCIASKTTEAHFVFSKLKPDGNEVDLFFTEPVDLEGSMASFIADKQININRVSPASRTKAFTIDRSNAAYLSASIDPPLEDYSEPVLIAGYLDYGEFGFGEGPKRHLTYTFNAQRSSTNPSQDWEGFFGALDNDAGYFDEGANIISPFSILFRNFGPSYEIAVRGSTPGHSVDVCIYDSKSKIFCSKGNEVKESISIVSLSNTEVMQPCGTYWAVANTTKDGDDGLEWSMWSTTSFVFNGPCPNFQEETLPHDDVNVVGRSLTVGVSLFWGVMILLLVLSAVLQRRVKQRFPRHKFLTSQESSDETAVLSDGSSSGSEGNEEHSNPVPVLELA